MIVALSDRPDLAPLVAAWRIEAFFQGPGPWTEARMLAALLAPKRGPEETFVCFAAAEPVGTASLVCQDLESRPDLTPWLAGVVVQPAHRLRGHASALVRRVEAFARQAGVAEIFLYTSRAEGLYARLGWQRMGLEWDKGREVVLMRRALQH
ncbi:GNAT family N-acetyltransferase [Falsiroseomonas selenitidurans]|uniref:GNAT family N-acetyltransferase n=1 Tax=Falsiroseomonas selenitidurans TaxID=2716335 RepID=A0ABX1E8T0_9PROT|nr:GNAT family N-acetyltransferase [Falsiroseomonas selenitidurans]NKC32213.1 GNAT family N-acetyltransferase [Falsiroseomonas selenitidurans]